MATSSGGLTMGRFTAIISFVIFTSCATKVKHRYDLRGVLNSWKDQTTDALVSSWGGPDSIYLMENGRTVLTFSATSMKSTTNSHHSYFLYDHIHSSKVFSSTCRISWFTYQGNKKLEYPKLFGHPEGCRDFLIPAPEKEPQHQG